MPENTAPDATLTDKLSSRKFIMAVLFNVVVAALIALDKLPAKEGMSDILYVTMTYLGVQGLVDAGGLLASRKGQAVVAAVEELTGVDVNGDGKAGQDQAVVAKKE